MTDLYEWGWGQSFHFARKLPNKNWAASEAAHEAWAAATIRLGPGRTALDVGCGVGGPMRTVAAVSGGNVVGITINEYQVKRATYHNDKVRVAPWPDWASACMSSEKGVGRARASRPPLTPPPLPPPIVQQGLAAQCKAVRGNFLDMPFEAATFDGAYAMEATCHAPTLEQVRRCPSAPASGEQLNKSRRRAALAASPPPSTPELARPPALAAQVYGEVYRVLKPGSFFMTYEWVSTPAYDPANPQHVAIMDEIIIGNGLPNMRSWKQAEEAGKAVGFKLLESRDVAQASKGAVQPWCAWEWGRGGGVGGRASGGSPMLLRRRERPPALHNVRTNSPHPQVHAAGGQRAGAPLDWLVQRQHCERDGAAAHRAARHGRGAQDAVRHGR